MSEHKQKQNLTLAIIGAGRKYTPKKAINLKGMTCEVMKTMMDERGSQCKFRCQKAQNTVVTKDRTSIFHVVSIIPNPSPRPYFPRSEVNAPKASKITKNAEEIHPIGSRKSFFDIKKKPKSIVHEKKKKN